MSRANISRGGSVHQSAHPLSAEVAMASEPVYPLVDAALSRRLERTEGHGSAAFVEARRQHDPGSGAEWIAVGGTLAMFDGPASPITQTFGLGMFEPVTEGDLDRLETFFRERGTATHHEVSPLTDPALLSVLCQRGYQPIELTSILFRPISPDLRLTATRNEKLNIRRVGPDEAHLYARTSAKGWSEFAEVAGLIEELALVGALREGGHSFLAELDGAAIATGGMHLHEGVALMAGASTVPESRKQGAQLALLEARLRYAAEQGCDLAMMGALPGSGSQRNAERHGFRIAYTRIKWRRA